ncbi:MAG: T9SS type A sorting domain-containing protein [bacterium]|nr:T9SS type A sorting domain-containing protein [bacterium]
MAAAVVLLFTYCVTAAPAKSQVAAPGDVYYDVHLDHTFKYGPFANDIVVWQDSDYSGTAMGFAAARDTVLVNGAVSSIATSIVASGGVFRADVNTAIDVTARTGAFLYNTNRLIVDVYVKGPSGTPFRVVIASDGHLLASRLGGLPGSLQPVNGVSAAAFGDSNAIVDYTGTIERDFFWPRVHAGQSSTEITVGPDTYSLAGSYSTTLINYTTQAICILGCMTAPADFIAHVDGLVAMDVYLCDDPGGAGPACDEVPSAVPDVPIAATSLQIEAYPNPFNPHTQFRFNLDAAAVVDLAVHDISGRRIRHLLSNVAHDAGDHVVNWDGRDDSGRQLASGKYYCRLTADGGVALRSVVMLK